MALCLALRMGLNLSAPQDWGTSPPGTLLLVLVRAHSKLPALRRSRSSMKCQEINQAVPTSSIRSPMLSLCLLLPLSVPWVSAITCLAGLSMAMHITSPTRRSLPSTTCRTFILLSSSLTLSQVARWLPLERRGILQLVPCLGI
jgi:hypothetical protein